MKWIIEFIIEQGLTGSIGFLQKVIGRKKHIKKIELEVFRIMKEFQEKYGDRDYYNSLDAFLTRNKSIKNLISLCDNMFQNKKNYIELIKKIVDTYLCDNIQYNQSRDDIEICLKYLFDCSFRAINDLDQLESRKLANIISKELTDNTNDIKQCMNNGFNKVLEKNYLGISNSFENVSMDNNSVRVPQLLERPLIAQNVSSRYELVKELIEKIKKLNWIHIWGEMWTGKTVLLYLISENLMNYEWIDMDKIQRENIVADFKSLFEYILNKNERSLKDAINDYILGLPCGSIIFIDGIQESDISTYEFCTFLAELYNACKKYNIKIITSGYCKIKSKVTDCCVLDFFEELDIPPLKEEDVMEILGKYNAPVGINYDNVYKILNVYGWKIPGLVVEMIKDIRDANWTINETLWNKIFSSDIGNLEARLEKILVSKLSEDERKLLYRISFVGHDVRETIVGYLAQIQPLISDLEKVKLQLYGRWVQVENGVLKRNKLYSTIAAKNLNSSEKKKIHEFAIEQFKIKKCIDQIDFVNLISHLIALGQVDEVGRLYVEVLGDMIDNKVKENTLGIPRFWTGLPLPSNMSPEIKVIVRIQQIRYANFSEQDCAIYLNDLFNIAEVTGVGGELILAIMVMCPGNFDVSRMCMEEALKLDLWHESQNKLMEMLKENILWTDVVTNIFDMALMCYALATRNNEQLSMFVHHLLMCDIHDIKNFFQNNQHLLSCICENVRKNNNSINVYVSLLEKIIEWSESQQLHVITAQMYACKMKVLSENLSNYEGAVELYNKINEGKYNDEFMHVIVDTMSKISIDNKSINIDLISKAYNTIVDSAGFEIDDIYTCLNYMEYANEKDDKLGAANKMMHIASKFGQSSEDKLLFYEVKGEYFINTYLCGTMENEITNFHEYIKAIFKDNFKCRRILIVYIAHIIGYIVPDIISGNPPKILDNGEEYLKPYRKMLMNMNEADEVDELYTEEKKNLILIFISKLLYFYKRNEDANNIILNLAKNNSFVTENVSYILANDSFLSNILLDNQLYREYFEVVRILFSNDEVKEVIAVRILCFIALYVVKVIKQKGELHLDYLIKELKSFSGNALYEKYLFEFGMILSAFDNENGDCEILLWCGEKIKGTEISKMSEIVNILMLAKLHKTNNGNVMKAVEKYLKEYNVNDVFVRRIIDVLY